MTKMCSVEGCGRPFSAKGLCTKHYDAWRYASVPGVKERIKAAASANRQSEEGRAAKNKQARAYQKRRYDTDPVFRAKKAAADKERRRSPEYRPRDQAVGRAHMARRNNRKAGIDPAGIQAALDSGMSGRPCARCGVEGPSHIDHILPIAWADTPEVAEALGNVWAYQPLCLYCNSRKGAWRVEAYVPTGDIGD